VSKGYGEHGHINQLTGQAIEQRDDAPSHLPTELLTEVDNDKNLVRLRCARNEAWRRVENAVPGVFNSSPYRHSRNETDRRASREAIRAHIDDIVGQELAVKLFDDAYNAVRTYSSHRQRLIDHKLAAYREDWFKQANASDALYRPTTATTSTQTAGASSSPPAPASKSALAKLFHPESELEFLSLELVEALALDCDPREQSGAKIPSQNKPQTEKLGDRTTRRKTKEMPPQTDGTAAEHHQPLPAKGRPRVKRKYSSMTLDDQDVESIARGKKSKAERGRVCETRSTRVTGEECPAIEVGYIAWDEEQNKIRTVYL
jgi:hypothetical protein